MVAVRFKEVLITGDSAQTCSILVLAGAPNEIPGKYLLLNQLIPGWLAKLNKFKILAGKEKI